MSRPKTKKELIDLSQKKFLELNDFVDSLSEREQQAEFSKGFLNRNIRDVLGHLHHWHLMFLDWHKVGMKGGKPSMPATGYTWKDIPKLNIEIQRTYRTMDLKKTRALLRRSFSRIQAIIKNHSNKELFTKGRYKWTGTTSMGAYLVSVTSSHYDWASKLIKRAK